MNVYLGMVTNFESMDDSSNAISNFVNFVAGGTCARILSNTRSRYSTINDDDLHSYL